MEAPKLPSDTMLSHLTLTSSPSRMMLSNAAPNVDPRTARVRREKRPQRSRFSIRQALGKISLMSGAEGAIYFQLFEEQPRAYQDAVTPLSQCFACVPRIKSWEAAQRSIRLQKRGALTARNKVTGDKASPP